MNGYREKKRGVVETEDDETEEMTVLEAIRNRTLSTIPSPEVLYKKSRI